MRKTYSLLAFLLLTLTRVAVAQDIIIADPQPVSQPAVQLPLPAADNLWLNEVRGRLDNMMYDRLLQNTQLGLLVYDLTAHQVVYQKNERQRMRPASVMKLVTSITALDMLGGDYQYHTGICYRGHLEGDTLVGDLYFVGGFDPTLTRDDLRMMADNRQSGSDAEYLRSRLTAAFAKLPPILREAYTLFQIGEMSIRDIANQTGVSENLVKVRIFRAKEKLREILADLRVT